jgi:hypothetical protein
MNSRVKAHIFGSNIVNLPDGKPQSGKGGWDFFIRSPVLAKRQRRRTSMDSSGFDSSAVRGIWSFALAPPIDSAFRYAQQSEQDDIVGARSSNLPAKGQKHGNLAALGSGVDGNHNFGMYDKGENQLFVGGELVPEKRQYSPWIQVVMTRTFKDRLYANRGTDISRSISRRTAHRSDFWLWAAITTTRSQ